jgi:hypothetical protein
VLAWLRVLFRDYSRSARLSRWEVEERARTGFSTKRLPAREHFLRVRLTQRVGEAQRTVEGSQAFPPDARAGAAMAAKLAALRAALVGQLTIL